MTVTAPGAPAEHGSAGPRSLRELPPLVLALTVLRPDSPGESPGEAQQRILAAADETGADVLARALRPLLRRDMGIARAWTAVPYTDGTDEERGAGLAALLGASALVAAVGGALQDTARVVDGLGAGARQWHPVLAAVFADLLACESLTTVALRSPCPGAGPLADAVCFLVPQLAAGLLGDLELVLHESGFGPDHAEYRALSRIEEQRAATGVDWTAAAAHQTRFVRALPGLAGDGQDPAERALFRITSPAPVGTPGPAERDAAALAATLPGTAVNLAVAADGDPATAALSRLARRLVTEQRLLGRVRGAHSAVDPAEPAARAAADRHALLLLAAAALGVREAAAGTGRSFLGAADWALLAVERVGRRLGVPLPGHTADPAGAVWAELALRCRLGIDCDTYTTQPERTGGTRDSGDRA
jgi:hypothetical protein